MSLGQKGSADPGVIVTSLLNKREKLRQKLRSIEKQVYELETSYLQESSHIGNALKGLNLKDFFLPLRALLVLRGQGGLNQKTESSHCPQSHHRLFRLVCLSTLLCILAEELGVGREDGRAELGAGRPEGGLSTAQGKPRKGRGEAIAREAKRSRPSTEPAYDDEIDPDMNTYAHGSLIQRHFLFWCLKQ